MKGIPTEVKAIFTSAGPFIASIFLFFLVGNFGISKISDIRTQISAAQADQNILSQKVNLLQSVSSNVGTYSNEVATALPDSNTSLAVISQIKNIAIANSLLVTNIKGSGLGGAQSGILSVDIGFDLEGGHDQVISFFKELKNIAPITTVSNIKWNETAGAAKVSATVKSYWAALPKTLPTTTEAITSLSADEQSILTGVNSLIQPVFLSVPPSTGGKSDPFNK